MGHMGSGVPEHPEIQFPTSSGSKVESKSRLQDANSPLIFNLDALNDALIQQS